MSVLDNLGGLGIFPHHHSVTALRHIANYELCVVVPRTSPDLKVILHLQFDVSAAAPLVNEITALLFALGLTPLSSSTLPNRTYCSVLLWW